MSKDQIIVTSGTLKNDPKRKKWRLERMQSEAKAELKVFNKDFLEYLPWEVRDILNSAIWRWKRHSWFDKAWNEYRKHVLDAVKENKDIKAPGFIFNDYIDEQVKKDFDEEEQMCFCHEDLDVGCLSHSGIKGQKWGVRRFQNEDGSLTEAGKRRYLKGYAEIEFQNNPHNPETDKDKYDAFEKQRQEKLNNIGVDKFDKAKWEKDDQESQKANIEIAKELQKSANTVGNAINTNKGSKAINNKDYSKISDEEMKKRINRLTMEKQYGDLTGDTKYVMTGKEKAKEIFQTIGAALGIAVSALTVKMLYDNIKGNRAKASV